jgi:hypothetical protein
VSDAVIAPAIGALGTIVVAVLVFKGGQLTAASSRDASIHAARVEAQDSALDAWSDLITPYREEVAELRSRMRALEQTVADEREVFNGRMLAMTERVDLLTVQVRHWKRVARSMAALAAQMRDEVISLGGTVPPFPEEELLLIRDLDSADDKP